MVTLEGSLTKSDIVDNLYYSFNRSIICLYWSMNDHEFFYIYYLFVLVHKWPWYILFVFPSCFNISDKFLMLYCQKHNYYILHISESLSSHSVVCGVQVFNLLFSGYSLQFLITPLLFLNFPNTQTMNLKWQLTK